MATISQRELRNDNAAVVRRVEEGESFTVTKRGVPVADLVPHDSRRRLEAGFVSSHDVVVAFADTVGPESGAWLRDIRGLDDLLDDTDRDPWARGG